MQKIYLLSIYFSAFFFTLTANDNIELTISGAQQTKMPIALLIPKSNNKVLHKIAKTIKKDLLFVDQFEPSIITYDSHTSKKELQKKIQKLAHSGIPLALFISEPSEDIIDMHLYDTTQSLSLSSKRYKQKKSTNDLSHKIADEIRKTLTGNKALFSSKIAYCKKNIHNNSSKLYVADFDGSNEKLVIDSASVIIAPRWHKETSELFYSEYTNTSIQLKSISLKEEKQKRKQKNISPFESGINMSADYAPNGIDYVFCASCGNGSCQIYLYKDGILKQCTNNSGNNDSPVFMDKDRICFCSNFQTGNPQIYIGNISTGHIQRITKGGYCTDPSYCTQTNRIVYHMMIQGIMQIMIYDCATKTHKQLTFDRGNKHNVSWSPDGTFILYAHEEQSNSSQLKAFNVTTKNIKIITKDKDYCNYPNWSN